MFRRLQGLQQCHTFIYIDVQTKPCYNETPSCLPYPTYVELL